MGFIELVTGKEMSKQIKELNKRIKKLPGDYQNSYKEVEKLIWMNTNDTIGREVISILDSVVSLLEEGSLDNLDVNTILGKDKSKFVDDLLGNDKNNYRDKWREQLNNKVMKKLNRK